MKVFLSLCLLFSLVSPEELQTCRLCMNEEGTECTKNDTENCRYSEPSCASTIISGNVFSFLPRASYSCGFCEEGYYAFNTGSRGSFNMVCCGSDNCNAKPLRMVLLTCTVCENQKGTECTKNDTEECTNSEYLCTSAVVNGNLFSFLPRAYYSCGYCEAGHYALNTGSSGFFGMVVECCGSDNCNAKPLEIPSESMEPNGGQCLGCYAEDQEECSGSEMVECFGDQTKCMKIKINFSDYSLEGFRSVVTATGCATPDICEEYRVKQYVIKSDVYPVLSTLECHDAV